MTGGLNWDAFIALPGDARANFERLCMGACWRAYARYGRFAARAQQPGVEFHLTIEQAGGPLGDKGRHYGWQTKWWDLPAGRPISKTRRDDVVDSLNKTVKHLPELTDWVLWTRRPLTAGDQEWFYGLQKTTNMRLHLWTESHLHDDLLAGDASLLREAYFGSLILTPERLAELHNAAADEVRPRWMPQVHQPSAAELRLRRMLAEPDVWDDLSGIGAEIARYTMAVNELVTSIDGVVRSQVDELIAAGSEVTNLLTQAHTQLNEGRATALVGVGHTQVPGLPPKEPTVLRKLRGLRNPATPPLTNLVAYIRDAIVLAGRIDDHLTARLAVVTGDAGFGKTQLAATLTKSAISRPAGILLFGRHLAARANLDDFARQVTISGKPVESFESLLAAVDAAAARSGCRLPIVIDGLNEAEAAGAWSPLLSRLYTMLERYPSVIVICTIRKSFVDEAIPADLRQHVLELDGFDEDLDEAIARYFAYYKIESMPASPPRELLNHPLTLKIYCDVANPGRTRPVSAERLPQSLTGLFTKYLEIAAKRIGELNHKLSQHDAADALNALGHELWETRARDVPESRAKALFGDVGRRWKESLLPALEREGIVIRQSDGDQGTVVAIAYDLLAGHVVATGLLHTHGSHIGQLLGTDVATEIFSGEDRHPLSIDIFDALAGAMPRGAGKQLWQVVSDRLKGAALLRTTSLEAEYLDEATVAALARNIDILRGRDDIVARLYTVHAAPLHPLNAHFLDSILRQWSVADRDLRWTEWLRSNASRLQADIAGHIMRWREQPERSESDHLRAKWLMWTLTSTDRNLRDAATAALFFYGCNDVDNLFSLTAEAFTVNDLYVVERMAAASYGVTTTKQQHDPAFAGQLSTHLQRLMSLLTGAHASAPTYHALTRYYISGTIAFARKYYADVVPAGAATTMTFAAGPELVPLRDNDPRRDEVRGTLGMDFGNYTLGRLFPDRGNYDSKHPAHRDATDHLLGVVHALGWRKDTFSETERRIRDNSSVRRNDHKVERYGKKYGWIGLHTVAGLLTDAGRQLRRPEVDIDPTFPQPSQQVSIRLNHWAQKSPADDRQWLQHGIVVVPDEFLAPAAINGEDGPWVLVHAEIENKDHATGRTVFGLFNTVIVEAAHADQLLEWMNTVGHPGRDLIDIPGAYYTFAGEIPWHTRFAEPEPGQTLEDVYSDSLWRGRIDLPFERLAHHFAWEPYHSKENQANGYVPSRLFSEAFSLHSIPTSFDQVEPSGVPATRSFSAPPGFEGDLLYARADLLRRYAAERVIVTFGWGERQAQFVWPEGLEEEEQAIYQAHTNIWRIVRQH